MDLPLCKATNGHREIVGWGEAGSTGVRAAASIPNQVTNTTAYHVGAGKNDKIRIFSKVLHMSRHEEPGRTPRRKGKGDGKQK